MNSVTEMFAGVDLHSGAIFSQDRKHRLKLWRIWDNTKPILMFVGLNPSKANETKSDNTITKLVKITKSAGAGGFYMMNLFTYVSTNPEELIVPESGDAFKSDMQLLVDTMKLCDKVVFAWGNFVVAQERAKCVVSVFDNAYCLHQNKNGSPKHPLYCLDQQPIISFDKTKFK